MFTTKQARPNRNARRAAVAYPRFGGRPVRRSVAGHPATVALALLAAIAATALSLPSFAGQAGARSAVETLSVAPRDEVRTTEKTDRLKPPVLNEGCDGVWGNEPLECLLQTA